MKNISGEFMSYVAPSDKWLTEVTHSMACRCDALQHFQTPETGIFATQESGPNKLQQR